MKPNLPLIALIFGLGIALGGLIRLLRSDDLALPIFLMASGVFCAVAAYGALERR
ncbi:MAG: hypothetical protein QGG34_04310 [SAR202 cluster bacterium]|jgi:hypothetical protein|nr:hypothetical protein [SAR202 cluster bacterium]MDP7102767.1 hypothetical protein [SAR202 cluster bacterium]MDP7224248.1 hypothetical protein [SAR202 cluster bacterium]MDP7414719.1 hypothetical protein [SAR202 cluster bacterium]MDP7533241.1 hypothetical protein [SAR202 cluster bacterium]